MHVRVGHQASIQISFNCNTIPTVISDFAHVSLSVPFIHDYEQHLTTVTQNASSETHILCMLQVAQQHNSIVSKSAANNEVAKQLLAKTFNHYRWNQHEHCHTVKKHNTPVVLAASCSLCAAAQVNHSCGRPHQCLQSQSPQSPQDGGSGAGNAR